MLAQFHKLCRTALANVKSGFSYPPPPFEGVSEKQKQGSLGFFINGALILKFILHGIHPTAHTEAEKSSIENHKSAQINIDNSLSLSTFISRQEA